MVLTNLTIVEHLHDLATFEAHLPPTGVDSLRLLCERQPCQRQGQKFHQGLTSREQTCQQAGIRTRKGGSPLHKKEKHHQRQSFPLFLCSPGYGSFLRIPLVCAFSFSFSFNHLSSFIPSHSRTKEDGVWGFDLWILGHLGGLGAADWIVQQIVINDYGICSSTLPFPVRCCASGRWIVALLSDRWVLCASGEPPVLENVPRAMFRPMRCGTLADCQSWMYVHECMYMYATPRPRTNTGSN